MASPDAKEIADALVVPPEKKGFALADRDPGARPFFQEKKAAIAAAAADARAINALQDNLFAEGRRALLVVLQGIDTAGKSGTVRAVFNETGPLGVRVTGFGKPSAEELGHDYLWRCHAATPRKGCIGIWDRSHYEDVLVVRVRQLAPLKEVEKRYAQINAFEKHLVENHVTVLKFFLHISREEQAERLRARLEEPAKRWKFNPADLDDRELWNDYMEAYDLALDRCSTKHAPWYVVPGNSKTRRNAMIARMVRGTLEAMDPKPRDPGFEPRDFKID